MRTENPAQRTPQSAKDVPWADVVRFVRQLSHDLRNHLNAVELQSAFLAELATDPELKEEIKRLRQIVSQSGSALQKLSARLNPPAPSLTPYPATHFVEDLQTKIGNEFPSQAGGVRWKIDTGNVKLAIDPQLLQEAMLELFRNAFEHQVAGSSLDFNAIAEGDTIVLTLYEPKSGFDAGMEDWAREPLRHVNRGHYGLGLNRARIIIESQGGQLGARHDPTDSKLITTVTVPVDRSQE